MFFYGKNPVTEALKSEQKIEALFVHNKKLKTYNDIIVSARKKGVKTETADDNFFNKKFKSSPHQGIAALIKSVSTISHNLDIRNAEFLLIADSITDPMNLGAIARSSVLFNADGLIIPEHESCGITPTVIKASSGAVFHQKIFIIKNLRNTIKELKSENFWIYGLDMDTDLTVNKLNVTKSENIALIVGSEGKGMHRIVRESCDFIVSIPTTKKIDSLNASNAASIAMWEIYKRKFLSS
ncbi:MAG: 23S rRNA (guanosine(2251)-2'-O)-methyltransferase RlmB [Proteobacteria bacterium]|nr:23S rRNA (guanosine(2251)-2'-O)-methyltransferase RlmB [Pseudomonadota bacterium]